MIYVYRVVVDISSKFHVYKNVIKSRVIKMDSVTFTVSSMPEDGATVKLHREQCFMDLETAITAADAKANVLIARMTEVIENLKKPAAVIDKFAIRKTD